MYATHTASFIYGNNVNETLFVTIRGQRLELEKAIYKKPCRHDIITGDFNAKIGKRNINDNMKCVRPFGIGNRNERDERLLEFTEEKNQVCLFVCWLLSVSATG